MKNSISKKIAGLNYAVHKSMTEDDNISIITAFTEESIRIFDADYGFVLGKFGVNDKYKLAYKSSKSPRTPSIPKNLKKNLIIPIKYFDHSYGSIILGYKNKPAFSKEHLALSETVGNAAAQAITVNWLVESERKAMALAEKQKETEVLLGQEKLKTEFISNITHELRTPLTIMRGNVYLARKNPKSSREALEVIDKEIVHLSEMLSDLVLVTSGSEITIHKDTLDLAEILSTVTNRLKSYAHEKNIHIKIKSKSKKIKFVGDSRHLERMFLNLVKNAITYGGTVVEVDISTNTKTATVKISDDGIGISKENLPRIFERFFRADKSRTRSDNRTGLGLSIVKKIAEMHGGRIEVKSTLGIGSVFTVTLPLRKA